jgi:hypothetical protein
MIQNRRVMVHLTHVCLLGALLFGGSGSLLAQAKKKPAASDAATEKTSPPDSEDEPDLTKGGSPFELEGTDPIDAGPPPEEMPEITSATEEGEESVLPNEANLRADDPEVPDSNVMLEHDESRAFRIGPSLSLGIPQPFAWSLEMMFGESWSGGFSLGSNNSKFESVNVSISSWDVRARWHPFDGSFFFATAFGSQKIKAEMKKSVDGVDTKFIVTATNRYVTPHLGWFSVWPGGLTLGFEAGWQLPMNPNSDFDAKFEASAEQQDALKSSEQFTKQKKDIEETAEKLTNKGIPYLKLLRIGWLF